MTSEEDAKKAIKSLNGSSFMERTLTVAEARPQKPRQKGGFEGKKGGYGRGRGHGRRG
jgi:RNA recognition motif-containing protein